jgi:hypothetical protein
MPPLRIKTLLVIIFVIETICITYGQLTTSSSVFVSILYFLTGISFSVILLWLPHIDVKVYKRVKTHKGIQIGQWVFAVAGAAVIALQAKYLMNSMPIDIQYADMLPIIHVMDKRLISGHPSHVYDSIPEIWHGTKPIYLPAMWAPFAVTSLFGIDMRWVTAACLFIAFCIFIYLTPTHKHRALTIITFITALLLFWFIMIEDDLHGVVTRSEEGVVMIYYIAVVLALASENIYITAIAVTLCMLSRYALIGWIPAFVVYMMIEKKWKHLLWFCGIGLFCFLFFFVFPFGWNTFTRLLTLPGQYVDFARRVWNDSPEVFTEGVGLAALFGPEHIALQHHLLLILAFVVPMLFVLTSIFFEKKYKLSNIPLATLKLSIVIFYNFIDVPYLYLFFTSSFISLMIVVLCIRTDDNAIVPA